MKHTSILNIVLVALGVAFMGSVTAQAGSLPQVGGAAQAALGTSFTYQGSLKQSGTPYTGVCSFQFGLWDAASAGSQLGSTLSLDNVSVTDGLFTVALDFGNQFNGNARWLETSVKCTGDGSFTLLIPRQFLTATPYAIRSSDAGAVQGYPVDSTAPASGQVLKWNGSAWTPSADNASGGGSYSNGFGLNLIGNVFSVLTSTIQSRVYGSCSSGQYVRSVNADGTVICGSDANSGGTITNVTTGFGLAGGGGTGSVALNVVTNTIQARVSGSCSSGNAIRVVNADGSVMCEPIGSSSAWSLTGNSGTDPATNFLGTTDNLTLTFRVSNTEAYRITPGFDPVNGFAPNVIGGASTNQPGSGVYGATIGGGSVNTANGIYATIGGGIANTIPAAAGYATIGGGVYNTANYTYTTVGGGYQNSASRDYATVGGGRLNGASNSFATVSGGQSNIASGLYATVGGGFNNSAFSDHATVSGGYQNTVTASGTDATIGGGESNIASEYHATVGGGEGNTASGLWATVGGGGVNFASGTDATVGGGGNNTASGPDATVGGGLSNTASGTDATVGGGYGNSASGTNATIPGGRDNTASGYDSFAAGYNAHATHAGSFVWVDNYVGSNGTYGSSANDQFRVFATGGVQFITGMNFSNGTVTSGSFLNPGSGTWSSFSDRNVKANFENVDPRAILAGLNSIPIQKWNYIAQDASIRHIGPMAQDFYAAFGVGEDERYIGVVDADGVALAAIQGLSQVVQDKDAQIATQQKQIDSLEARVAALEAAALEEAAPTNTAGARSTDTGNIALMMMGGLIGIVVAQKSRQRNQH